ncbi:receptor-type tyrosine-protein phosphatase alpha-like [Clavelina lepadiformis]|uniref:receptor-type tyrosine-protein phosphatase alpha-like n=1 Tax=Clavelina lepadiformis TaxID=159417 RepID=UPI0040437E6A
MSYKRHFPLFLWICLHFIELGSAQQNGTQTTVSNDIFHFDLYWIIPLSCFFVLFAVFFFLLSMRERTRMNAHRGMTKLMEENLAIIKELRSKQHDPKNGTVPENYGRHAMRASQLRQELRILRDEDNRGFLEQFTQELPLALSNLSMSSNAAKKEENLSKNRFKNVIPYDKTRVKLTPIDDDPNSDYINANYIDSYDVPKKYIATQGPKANTISDFWRMVWQSECGVIVMLANVIENGKRKCEKYWPEPNQPINYNQIRVSLLSEAKYDDYVVRGFTLSKLEEETRQVVQLQYLTWPDHGVPALTTGIIRFNERARKCFKKSRLPGPIVVHCSAGVGRTGTFIAFNVLMRELNYKASVNVYETVLSLRKQRIAMVQTARQYIFLHYLITETHELGNSDYDVKDLITKMKTLEKLSGGGKSGYDDEFQKLCNLDPVEGAKEIANEPENATKIPLSGVFPYDHSLVSMLPLADGTPLFYNASYVKAYYGDRFIAAQGPLQRTKTDFWHCVVSNDVRVIVSLTSSNQEEESVVCPYWPERVDEEVTYDHVTLVMEEEENISDNLIRRNFTASAEKHGIGSKSVIQLDYDGWSEDSAPSNGSEIIQLIESAQELIKRQGVMLVHCSDGVNRTGAFLALTNLIERVKCEQMIDVIRAVKDLRDMRPNMVKNVALYRYIYKTMADYVISHGLNTNSDNLEEVQVDT